MNEQCPECGCLGEQYDGHVCEDFQRGVLYFGCGRNTAGHYLRSATEPMRYEESPVPNLDGGYVPRNVAEGVVRVTKLDGWTIIAFRDNSVDRRGGSHSTFLIPGDRSYYSALARARAAFPSVFARLEERGIRLTLEVS